VKRYILPGCAFILMTILLLFIIPVREKYVENINSDLKKEIAKQFKPGDVAFAISNVKKK